MQDAIDVFDELNPSGDENVLKGIGRQAACVAFGLDPRHQDRFKTKWLEWAAGAPGSSEWDRYSAFWNGAVFHRTDESSYPFLVESMDNDRLEFMRSDDAGGLTSCTVEAKLVEQDHHGDKPSKKVLQKADYNIPLILAVKDAAKLPDARKVIITKINKRGGIVTCKEGGDEIEVPVSSFAGAEVVALSKEPHDSAWFDCFTIPELDGTTALNQLKERQIEETRARGAQSQKLQQAMAQAQQNEDRARALLAAIASRYALDDNTWEQVGRGLAHVSFDLREAWMGWSSRSGRKKAKNEVIEKWKDFRPVTNADAFALASLRQSSTDLCASADSVSGPVGMRVLLFLDAQEFGGPAEGDEKGMREGAQPLMTESVEVFGKAGTPDGEPMPSTHGKATTIQANLKAGDWISARTGIKSRKITWALVVHIDLLTPCVQIAVPGNGFEIDGASIEDHELGYLWGAWVWRTRPVPPPKQKSRTESQIMGDMWRLPVSDADYGLKLLQELADASENGGANDDDAEGNNAGDDEEETVKADDSKADAPVLNLITASPYEITITWKASTEENNGEAIVHILTDKTTGFPRGTTPRSTGRHMGVPARPRDHWQEIFSGSDSGCIIQNLEPCLTYSVRVQLGDSNPGYGFFTTSPESPSPHLHRWLPVTDKIRTAVVHLAETQHLPSSQVSKCTNLPPGWVYVVHSREAAEPDGMEWINVCRTRRLSANVHDLQAGLSYQVRVRVEQLAQSEEIAASEHEGEIITLEVPKELRVKGQSSHSDSIRHAEHAKALADAHRSAKRGLGILQNMALDASSSSVPPHQPRLADVYGNYNCK